MNSSKLIFKYFKKLNENQKNQFKKLEEIFKFWNSKVNLISSVIKPGYRLQTKENEFIILKNSEVQVFELES